MNGTLSQIDLIRVSRRDDVASDVSSGVYVSGRTQGEKESLDVHMHPGVEIGIQLAGRQRRYFTGAEYVVGPGEVWLCGAWEPHGWQFLDAEVDHICVQCMPLFLGEAQVGDVPWFQLFAVAPANRPRVISPEIRTQVMVIGNDLREEAMRKLAGWESPIRLQVLRLLLLVRHGWRPAVSTRLRTRKGDLGRIAPALYLVRARPHRRVSLEEAAAACCIQRSHFALVFRRTIGVSFGTYQRRVRVGVAAEMLASTDLTVNVVASATGFADESHLHQVFVKYFNTSPGRYRNSGASP